MCLESPSVRASPFPQTSPPLTGPSCLPGEPSSLARALTPAAPGPAANRLKNGEVGQALHSEANPFPQTPPAQAIFSHLFFGGMFPPGVGLFPQEEPRPPFHFSSLPTPCDPPPQPSSRRHRRRFRGDHPRRAGRRLERQRFSSARGGGRGRRGGKELDPGGRRRAGPTPGRIAKSWEAPPFP